MREQVQARFDIAKKNYFGLFVVVCVSANTEEFNQYIIAAKDSNEKQRNHGLRWLDEVANGFWLSTVVKVTFVK